MITILAIIMSALSLLVSGSFTVLFFMDEDTLMALAMFVIFISNLIAVSAILL